MGKKSISWKGLVFLFVVLLCFVSSGLLAAMKGKIAGRVTNNVATEGQLKVLRKFLFPQKFRRLSFKEYVDKMKGGWVGQMAGVGWGGPTEFHFQGKIIPESQMPEWKPALINQFQQDDIYVEMTFLRTLELYGLDVSIRQAGIDFANSKYGLWHANKAGRDNLRRGIAPPDCGHPEFNKHADDIDYQIEADFSGLIAPGLPNTAIKLGETFGRLMNYGDGLYGGQFVGGMYAEAFFETDMEKIIKAGLACIPAKSQYAECIRDVLKWWKQYPDNWQKTWELINEKYQKNPDYRRFSCEKGDFNIDAKINGAYIVMGLLYGENDPDKTIIISTRCGQDSDCNPSNAGGILFTTIGFSKIPDRFKSALNPDGKFSHTPYNFPLLIKVCEKLTRQAVMQSGGKIEKEANGQEILVVPVEKPTPGKLEQCWNPGPIANSRFTPDEMANIFMLVFEERIKTGLQKFAPGWTISNCADDMEPGLREEERGRKNVFVTHPLNITTGCVLSKIVKIPDVEKTLLRLVVGRHPEGDWELIVKADGKELFKTLVDREEYDGWMDVAVDLTDYAGKTVKLELVNQANNWAWEAGYWQQIELINSITTNLDEAIEKFAPGWKISNCHPDDMDPGLRAELGDRKNVLVTHPLDENTGCVLSKQVKIPKGKKTLLRLVVGHHPVDAQQTFEGDWELLVNANGKELLKTVVGKENAKDGWMDVDVDLTDYAGKTVKLELVNQANNWAWEAAYWGKIELMSE